MRAIHRFPILYKASVLRLRIGRHLSWLHTRFARTRSAEPLSFRVFRHASLLLRKLGNTDMRLQRNKVTNLRIACKAIDGIRIAPGETFSFWKLVGKPTARKGYISGMLLSRGEVKEGVGGGLCQLANLVYWMALHTPLTVTERYHHSFDAFPDSGRVLPFGSGATLFYNYVDLMLCNDTNDTFQIFVRAGETYLEGEIRSDNEQKNTFSVFERDHAFVRDRDRWFRKNEIWRKTTEKRTGKTLGEDLVTKNYAEVKYPVSEN